RPRALLIFALVLALSPGGCGRSPTIEPKDPLAEGSGESPARRSVASNAEDDRRTPDVGERAASAGAKALLADARGSETSRSEGASSETEPATSDAIETTDPRESTSDPDRPSTATDSTDEPEGERVAQSSASTSTSTKVASPDEASPAPSSSNDASGEASDATQAPPAASTPETTLPPRGQALYSELRELRKRIPIVVIDLGRPVAEVERDVLSAIEKGEAFLRDFGDSTQGAWVRATLGRDYLLRVRRFEEEVRNRVKADAESLPRQEAEEEIERAVKEELAVYTARMRKLASDAYSKAPAGSEARYLALLLLTDLSERDFDCESSLRYA